MKSVIIIAIVLLGCFAYNEALQCYSHDLCAPNCPQLSTTVKECAKDETRCYKFSLPTGVSRGCAKERCNVQMDVSAALANVCCEGNLCNSAVTQKMTFSVLLLAVGAFFLARM